MKLVFFDIDGTLIDSGGAGTRSLDIAFREVFSILGATESISMAGKTDLQIIRETLAKHGLEDKNGSANAVIEAYAENLKKEIVTTNGHIKPGVEEILESLGSIPGVHIGLLTGNIATGAAIKLGSFGLDHYFTLNRPAPALFGAFGSDHEDRNRLLPIGTAKFREITGIEMGYNRCVIVGDTPKDVACARPYGALAVTVATGPYSAGELQEAGADFVFDDLTDNGALQAILT